MTDPVPPSLFEPDTAGLEGQVQIAASIAISLKRIADVMQGGPNKHARSMNTTLSEIAQHLVHLVAKK
jgi:hypothetical protein